MCIRDRVKGETFQPTERVKVYILEVKDTPKGPRILVSRTHPGLVKRLFESEVEMCIRDRNTAYRLRTFCRTLADLSYYEQSR